MANRQKLSEKPRTPVDVIDNPQAGDVIEAKLFKDNDYAQTIRVVCVVEDHIGYKQYGGGWHWKWKGDWRLWLREAREIVVVARQASRERL